MSRCPRCETSKVTCEYPSLAQGSVDSSKKVPPTAKVLAQTVSGQPSPPVRTLPLQTIPQAMARAQAKWDVFQPKKPIVMESVIMSTSTPTPKAKPPQRTAPSKGESITMTLSNTSPFRDRHSSCIRKIQVCRVTTCVESRRRSRPSEL